MCKGNNSKCTWEENDFQKNVVLGILKHLQQKGAMKGVTRALLKGLTMLLGKIWKSADIYQHF